MDYPTGIHQKRFAALRARGVLVGGLPVTSDASGGQTPATADTRSALVKAEAKAKKAAEPHLALLADDESSTADRDAACIADAQAQRELRAASEAHRDAIEANAPAVEAWATAQAEEAGARALEHLAQAREDLQAFALTDTLARAMRDHKSHRRHSPPTSGSGRLPGGTMIDNLTAIVEREVGKTEVYDRVGPEEMRKLQRGESAVTVDGREVTELHDRVRVQYAPPLQGPQGAW